MESLLAHAKTLSVEEFLCVCIDLEHFDDVFSLARRYPQICNARESSAKRLGLSFSFIGKKISDS
jgi:Tat protein secretion system quality control protein TatD with DNase activity